MSAAGARRRPAAKRGSTSKAKAGPKPKGAPRKRSAGSSSSKPRGGSEGAPRKRSADSRQSKSRDIAEGAPRKGGTGTSHSKPRRGDDRGLGGEQVEGRQAVRELLLAGTRKVHEVWVASDPDDTRVVDDLADLAMNVGVAVRDVSRSKLLAQARTEAPQGVLAKARALVEVELDTLAKPSRGAAQPFLVAVDGVTDPGNLGALLRTAESAGVTGVVLPRHRTVHITPMVTKAAAGAIEYLPMAIVGGLPTAVSQLKELGVWVIGLDSGGSTSLFDLAIADEPVCLILGAEGRGLSRLVRERCDVVASIPLAGRLGSLNVAAAGALACFEVARRRLAEGAV